MKQLAYSVDSKPPFFTSLFAGFQHVLTMAGSTLLVPFILGNAMKMSTTELSLFISCVLFSMSIATLLQINTQLGSSLPLVQGSSFSFISPILAIISMFPTISAPEIMQYILGGVIIGGLIEAIIGYSSLIGKIKKVITPIVICPVIMAIGFSLAGTAVSSASSYWPVSISVVILILFFSLICKNRHINIFSVLSVLTIMYLICLFLSGIGIFNSTHPAFIDTSKIISAPWFRNINSITIPFGIPKFSIMVIIALLPGFFASMIESIGDYHSVSYAAGLDDPSETIINKGIGSEGIGVFLSGFLGSIPSTSYSENIGMVNLTGMASRYVVGVGAVILMIISFIGKFSTIIATMPPAILGGAYIILFALIGSSGLSIFGRANMNSQRNLTIIGVSFLLALGLPSWIESNKEFFMNDSYNIVINTIGSIAWSLLKSSMAVAGIIAILLDSIIPGTNEERGIVAKK